MKNILFLFTEIRTQPFIGKLTLAAILVLSAIVQVNAQGNPAAIDISDFSFTPSTIDTTNSSQTVTVTVRVTDTERDVSSIQVIFTSPLSNRYVYVNLSSQDRISGNARDGVYRTIAIFPQYSKAGSWRVLGISVSDGINRRFFPTTELAARGFATQLQVISNNEDLIPPEIIDFSFTPSAIDTTNGAQNITITVRATDATAGIREIYVYFLHPIIYEGGQFGVRITSANRISGDDKDGVYRVVFTFPQNAPSGMYGVSVSALDAVGNGKYLSSNELDARGYPAQLRITSAIPATRTTPFDFDGDGKADLSVFRPSNGVWSINSSREVCDEYNCYEIPFGYFTDKLVPADYDGDGVTDIAVYRDGTWHLRRSQLGRTDKAFGQAGDVLVPADYDGDGRAEVAVFRPSNGTWYFYNLATNQFSAFPFGQAGDVPVAADYDGDGKTDIAVFRSSNGTWYLQRSTLGFTGAAFGFGTDKPVPADYDGDGKADIAVFRPSNGVWYLLQSTAEFTGIQFGFGTDLPVPADYDGDGKTDIAVFRNGIWHLRQSTNGFSAVQFGLATDTPVTASYVP